MLVYLRIGEEQSCQISLGPIWNYGALDVWKRSPQQQEEEEQDE